VILTGKKKQTLLKEHREDALMNMQTMIISYYSQKNENQWSPIEKYKSRTGGSCMYGGRYRNHDIAMKTPQLRYFHGFNNDYKYPIAMAKTRISAR